MNTANNPLTWTTFQGKIVSSDTADHQHLSNCYWYWKLVGDSKFDSENFLVPIKERFNGQILPYRPHVDFKYEISALRRKGYLKQGDKFNFKQEIVYNGLIIGEILSPFE